MKIVNQQDKRFQKKTVVAQFGEGNFLRAFVDYMIDIANENGAFDGGVAIIKPIPYGSLERFEQQDCAYTVLLRGIMNGKEHVEKRLVSSVNNVVDPFENYQSYLDLAVSEDLRIVVSNTTEAGITYDETDSFDLKPAKTYPGKLVQFLYARYEAFQGAANKGLIILPVELIENNGGKLKECVLKITALWKLPEAFAAWVEANCIFCSTLVDRIVTGYPADEAEKLQRELGYQDELIVTGEPFALWVIESDRMDEVQKAFPLDQAGLPVVFTDDQRPYRERKVRILNGAHTSTVLGAYLTGLDTVGECMKDKTIRGFMEKAVYEEISPTVKLPADQVKAFSDSVMERFENPFIRHALLSISLNSVSKWKARVLPSVKDSLAESGKLPKCLVFSLAALIAFYRTAEKGEGCLIGKRGEESYEIKDDGAVLDFFADNAGNSADQLASALLVRSDFWGEDLTKIDGLCAQVAKDLLAIEENGMTAAIQSVIA